MWKMRIPWGGLRVSTASHPARDGPDRSAWRSGRCPAPWCGRCTTLARRDVGPRSCSPCRSPRTDGRSASAAAPEGEPGPSRPPAGMRRCHARNYTKDFASSAPPDRLQPSVAELAVGLQMVAFGPLVPGVDEQHALVAQRTSGRISSSFSSTKPWNASGLAPTKLSPRVRLAGGVVPAREHRGVALVAGTRAPRGFPGPRLR